MIERLPTPWGLVRLGVAPDHPKIKAVSKAFEKIAAQPGFRFLGNVEVGRDLTPDDLARLYDAVVYAVGAQTDRRMGIPGEDLPGSWPATEFVAWYNGHPDFQELPFDLSGERAVVVGAGNVAIDVVRMLALAPEEIRPTDTTDAAIEAILGSGLKEIVLLGPPRPGPGGVHDARAEGARRARRRGRDRRSCRPRARPGERGRARDGHERARGTSRCSASTRPARRPGSRSAIRLRFCVSPVAILGEERVEAIEIVRNRLVADEARPRPRRADRRARDDPVRDRLPQRRLPAASSCRASRSTSAAGSRTSGGRSAAGVYCAGWIKRGPSGVIGTNKKDATETVELLLEDARGGKAPPRRSERDRGDRRRAARRARRRGRDLRGVGGDRPGGADRGRAARPAAGQALSWDELRSAAARQASLEPSVSDWTSPFEGREPSTEGRFLLHGDSSPPGGVPQLRLPPRCPRGRARAPPSTSARSATTSAGPRPRSSPSAPGACSASGRSTAAAAGLRAVQ